MDYRRWYDSSDMLYAYDLEDAQGRDVVVQIEKVWGGEVIGEKGRKSKKPMVKFAGRDKTLALNKTNGKAIAKLYGKDATKWVGKWVALYVTTVDYNDEIRDCIRVRPKEPAPPQRKNGAQRAATEHVATPTTDAPSDDEQREIARLEAQGQT